jgi:hypothetical protein
MIATQAGASTMSDHTLSTMLALRSGRLTPHATTASVADAANPDTAMCATPGSLIARRPGSRALDRGGAPA